MSSVPDSSTGKRRPSFPSASSERILSTTDKPIAKTTNLWLKHGKYVALGAAGLWYTGMQHGIEHIWNEEGGWIRNTLVAAVGCHVSTIVIFLYLVLFLPYFRGHIPNYPKWQQSARLRVIVPLLTASILLGWTGYVVSLSQAGKRTAFHALGDALSGIGEAKMSKMAGERGMGLFSAMAGTTALYTLTLGLLGFIQAPANTPVRKRD